MCGDGLRFCLSESVVPLVGWGCDSQEDLVKELWQEGGFAGPTTPSTRAAEQLSCPPLRENVPEELRAKTLDEAWTLAHSAPGQPTQTQTQLQGGMKIGDYITKVLNRGNLSMQGQNPENSRQVRECEMPLQSSERERGFEFVGSEPTNSLLADDCFYFTPGASIEPF